jgi:uncharacterized protein
MPALTLSLEPDAYAVARLDPDLSIPSWARESPIYSITRTREELSVLCLESLVPGHERAERGWRLFRLDGVFPFSLTGILSSVLDPLGAVGVSIFALSTFDTDYVLVPDTRLETAIAALTEAGHTVNRL